MPADNRRRHQVYCTRHTEYHLRDDECVGVKDRGSGLWLLDHVALRLRALKIPSPPHAHEWVGHRIQFWGSNADVLTSPVTEVGRPEREDVGAYVSQARRGDLSRPEEGLKVSHH